MKKINQNYYVKFRLSEYGLSVYESYKKDLIRFLFEKSGQSYPIEPPKIYDDGFSRMQLWEFMNIFGAHMYVGGPTIIEDGYYYFDDEDLEEV